MAKKTTKKMTTAMKNGSARIVMSPGMRMVKIAGLYVTYAAGNIIFCALKYNTETMHFGLFTPTHWQVIYYK